MPIENVIFYLVLIFIFQVIFTVPVIAALASRQLLEHRVKWAVMCLLFSWVGWYIYYFAFIKDKEFTSLV